MRKLYASLFCISILASAHAQWNNNTADNLAVANINSADIQSASTSNGGTWVAFYSQNGNNYDMHAQLLDANGNRMFGDNGILVSDLTSGSATFVFNVCTDELDNLYIGFQIQKGSSYECIGQKVAPDGSLPWGKGVDLGPGLSPSVTAVSPGKIIFAWSNNGKILYQKIRGSGVAAWPTYKTFGGNSNHSVSRPQVVGNSNGSFCMLYQDQFSFPFYTNLFVQRFNNDGAPMWASATKISTLTTVSYRYFDLLNENDTAYIGYYGNPSGSNRFDAYVQKVNPSGYLPWGINGSAVADYSTDFDPYEQTTYIAKAAGVNEVWAVSTITNSLQTTSGIIAQKFDAATGQRYLGNYGKTVTDLNATLPSLAYSNLSLCNDAYPLFIATSLGNTLVAVKLNENGDKVWGSGRTIASSANTKFRYCFTGTYKGQAVAVWQEDKGSGDMPYAQNITCGGFTGSPAAGKTTVPFVIKNIYPNPVQSILSASVESRNAGTVHIYISNATGTVYKTFTQNFVAGKNTLQLDVSSLRQGMYFMRINNAANATVSVLFQKQ